MYRREILVNDALRQGLILDDVKDIPLHGLPAIGDAHLLILPVVGRLQEAVCPFLCLTPQVLLVLRDQLAQPFILLLGFEHRRDALDIILFRVQMLQLDLMPQQPPHLHLIMLGKQILCRRPLISPTCRFQLLISLCSFRFSCRCLLRIPGSFLVGIPFHGPQFLRCCRNSLFKVCLGPPPVFRLILAVIVLHRFFRYLDASCSIIHPYQLICRVRDAFREQFRRHGVQFLVCRIHRQAALIHNPQRAESPLAEVLEVGNVRLIPVADGHAQIPQMVLDVLVLVIEFRIHHNALGIGFLKQQIHRLLRDRPFLQVHIGHFLNDGLQILPPGQLRHTQLVCNGPQQLPLHPLQIILRLLRHTAAHIRLFLGSCRFRVFTDRILPPGTILLHLQSLPGVHIPLAVHVIQFRIFLQILFHGNALLFRFSHDLFRLRPGLFRRSALLFRFPAGTLQLRHIPLQLLNIAAPLQNRLQFPGNILLADRLFRKRELLTKIFLDI